VAKGAVASKEALAKTLEAAASAIEKVVKATDDFLNSITGSIVKMKDGFAFMPKLTADGIGDLGYVFAKNTDIGDSSKVFKIENIAGSSARLQKLDKAWDAYNAYKAGLKIADGVEEIVQNVDGPLAALTNQVRNQLIAQGKINSVQNVAVSKVTINGVQKELHAVSGMTEVEGCVPKLDDVAYKLNPVNANNRGKLPSTTEELADTSYYPRGRDTEVKLLENIRKMIAKDFNGNATGEILLHTRYEPCGSCLGVIKEFSELYPRLKIKVSWEIPYLD
jgi:hypothetical protein